MTTQRPETFRSTLGRWESVAVWLIVAPGLLVFLTQTRADWTAILFAGIAALVLWFASAWTLRAVVVKGGQLVERRFFPWKRAFPVERIVSVRLVEESVGAASLPATGVILALDSEIVPLKTLLDWALTRAARDRARDRARRLAAQVRAPFVDELTK